MFFKTNKKRTDRSRAIERLDRIFSKYIRLKYSVDGICTCYTCGRKEPINNIHCGHYQGRGKINTRWDEDNCRPQCIRCNSFQEGNKDIFKERLVKELGEEKVSNLILKSNCRRRYKIDIFEIELRIAEIKKLMQDITKNK